MKSGEWISARLAAERLGVGLNYLYTLLYSKKLECEKRDGKWLVSASSVEERRKKFKERK